MGSNFGHFQSDDLFLAGMGIVHERQEAENSVAGLSALFSDAASKLDQDLCALALKVRTGDKDAANSLIKRFLPLLIMQANSLLQRRITRTGACDRSDLVQAASSAVIVAASKFDPQQGTFRAFCKPFINRAMQKEFDKGSFNCTCLIMTSEISANCWLQNATWSN